MWKRVARMNQSKKTPSYQNKVFYNWFWKLKHIYVRILTENAENDPKKISLFVLIIMILIFLETYIFIIWSYFDQKNGKLICARTEWSYDQHKQNFLWSCHLVLVRRITSVLYSIFRMILLSIRFNVFNT